MIKATVGLINGAAAFGAGDVENLSPPIRPRTLLPNVDNVLFVSLPSAKDDGGRGGVLREEANPGFKSG